MALIHRIVAKSFKDILNEGMAVSETGHLAGAVVEQPVIACGTDRVPIILGFHLTTTAFDPVTVSIGFKSETGTLEFWRGSVSLGGPVIVQYGIGNWKRGDRGYHVVVTTDGVIDYTVDARISAELSPTGYVINKA